MEAQLPTPLSKTETEETTKQEWQMPALTTFFVEETESGTAAGFTECFPCCNPS